MKASTFFGGAWKGIKFVYNNPQVLEIAAAVAPGQPAAIAGGIATAIHAVQSAKAHAAGEPAPAPPIATPPPPAAVVPPPPAAPPDGPPPFPGVVVVPEVDLVGKWRGTLDRMAMEVLGHRMAEDELFNNAKLLERGDVEGVMKNLREKLPPEQR